MSSKKKSSSPPTPPPTEVIKPVVALPSPPPEKPKMKELLIITISSDDEILSRVPTLAKECKWLEFTSSEKCQSMEKWQIFFEQNGFKFVKDLHSPTIRTQLYKSIQ